MSENKIVVISAHEGYTKAPQIQQKYFETRYRNLQRYRNVLEMVYREPFAFDDAARPGFEQWLQLMVTQCETLICLNAEGIVVGLAILHVVRRGRFAEFLGWVNPVFRCTRNRAQHRMLREFMQDIFSYAWDTLKLHKLETRICIVNQPAQRFAMNIGFERIGYSKVDFQISEQLFDSVVLERINPALLFDEEPGEITHHGKRQDAVVESVPEPVRDIESKRANIVPADIEFPGWSDDPDLPDESWE